jgi:glutamyl-tRNA synthetase
MVSGAYKEGGAVLRVKTDLFHPNPAVRDWPAMRIIDTTRTPHPRVGSKFKAWPLYNLASGTDDHLMGITHIIRGKEHLTNMDRQICLYRHMGWKYPEAVHYGRLKVQGVNLSKSKLMQALATGEVTGVDDPRLGTLAALRRRGYSPETIRKLIWEVGPKPVDVTVSWNNIESLNRKIIDPTSHRYFSAINPTPIRISKVPKTYMLRLPLHPQHPEDGTRMLEVRTLNGEATVFVSASDIQIVTAQNLVRLMGLFTLSHIRMESGQLKGQFLSEDTSGDEVPIIQWVPSNDNVHVQVVMPDSSTMTGLGELQLLDEKIGSVIQLVRFGFCRIDAVDGRGVRLYFTHQ